MERRQRWFDRLPAAAQPAVAEELWRLSRHTAGMVVRFRTDAATIEVRYQLLDATLDNRGWHMSTTAISGLDLYARDDLGAWRWVAVGRPLAQDAAIRWPVGPGKWREFAVYLPIGNGVERLEIGVPADAKFEPVTPRPNPMVFYGTSITHGASASRPGMTHVAILGRRLDQPVINLGFAGQGRLDPALAELLGRQAARVYIIDCLPNLRPEEVAERCIPFVRTLRAARPTTPIVLVEDRVLTNAWIHPARVDFHRRNHAALKAAYETLVAQGVAGLHYLAGEGLLGDDSEGSVDGSHPSDLGFMRQADAMEPLLRRFMGDAKPPPGAEAASSR